jgi:hypothetical protein
MSPGRSFTPYLDGFGNKCLRVLAPPGELRIFSDSIISDTGKLDKVDLGAQEHPVSDLPHETLVHLLSSRYCEADLLMDKAWSLFGNLPPGWRRVQAICDFVHHHIAFNYQHADAKRGAAGEFEQRIGVCRDFAHLAVAFCRCLNIPARYCTGYLGDIGVPPTQHRWISARGSKHLSGAAGILSMLGTTRPGSGGCWLHVGAMLQTVRSARHSGRTCCRPFRSLPRNTSAPYPAPDRSQWSHSEPYTS